MNDLVSVIVPVYNTGDYLRKCISSILDQTYRNLQIIVIDDGSDPHTASICDELMHVDGRINVVHKRNEGVSVARNVGLSLAEGNVICFVDSDDTIDSMMINRLVSELLDTGADIAMCDAITVAPDRPDEPDTIDGLEASCVIETKDLSPAMLTQLAGSACRCAYRRTDMLVAHAEFPVGIKFSEDRIFNIIAMGCANKIAYIKEPFYNRLIREGSACFRFYPDMTDQIVKMREVLLSTVDRYWGMDYIQAFETQISGQIRYSITNYTAPYSGLKFSQKTNEVKRLCTNSAIQECLKNSNSADIRSKLMLNKNYIILTALGLLTNKYHKLCKIGQYQR